jgi:hypothetical protein
VSAEKIRHAAERWLDLRPSERVEVGPEVIGICAGALRELVSRLQAMGYPVDPMLVGCRDVDGAIARLQDVGPPVPSALAEVWRQIGQVSLVDLGGYRHMAFWEERAGSEARVVACDGVVIEGLCVDDAWVDYAIDTFDEQAEIGAAPGFPLSPDHLHKDNTSGGESYELVPDADDAWLAPLRGFSWVGPQRPTSAPEGSSPDLVSYLRTSILECGGFPGLFGTQGFEPIRHELVDGLPVF